VAGWHEPRLVKPEETTSVGPSPARAQHGNVDPDGQIVDQALLGRLLAAIGKQPWRPAFDAQSQLDLTLLALAGRIEEARA
jgi:hypothetical protein